ncbi:MAG: glycosyltransferase family 39 protein [Flavobacteriales bacterium]
MNNSLLIVKDNRLFWGVMILFTIIYAKGLFSIIYGIDASIYGSISAEMTDSSNWLQIYTKGKDYLDKPPLHLWLSATSFKLFGINTFSYKLPSFLFTILGIFSTYKLGSLLYSRNIGRLAALLLYTCFSIILINQDVRTDTILVGIIAFALWQLIAYVETNNYGNFILGFVGIGLAMLTKGPIGLMVPVLALGTHFLVKKEWKNIFKWQWILGLIISFLVISPMLWGLYQQFDLQPNKQFTLSSGIDGTGTSGLKFYFWDQSFGRITGSNKEWKDNTTILFFVHTFLWSFLPWSIMGVIALYKKIKSSFLSIKTSEFYTLGSIILPFIALSLSSYKLPHYILVFFPFWMILTSWYFLKLKPTELSYKFLRISHIVLNFLFVAVVLLVLIFIFPTKSLFIWIPVLVLLTLTGILYRKTKGKNQILLTTLSAFYCVMFVFSFHFVPKSLEYDGFYNAATETKDMDINNLYSNTEAAMIFDVYSKHRFQQLSYLSDLEKLANKKNFVFVSALDFEEIKVTMEIKWYKKYSHFSLTRLTAKFLNPATRSETFEYFYLVEV